MVRHSLRVESFLLTLALLAGLAAPALAAETAAVIRLTKTTGTVEISKSSGKSVSLLSNMRLYNGYHVETAEESYAWINLDDSKLLKEDAASEVEVRKDGKKLEVLVASGNVFFDVAEDLEDDESLNIRTSTMVVGIRGTSGWIEVVDRWITRVSVLEGEVECSVADPVTGQIKAEKIRGGETVLCVVYPQERTGDKSAILRDKYTVDDIPGFVLAELVRNIPLCDKIEAKSGLDIPRDLAVVAGGDPSGRTPDRENATPEVLGEADRREDEDESELREKLEAVEKEQEKQGDTVSPDKAVPKPAPSAPSNSDSDSDSSGSSSGGSGSTPVTPPERTHGMKLRDVEVQALLADQTVLSIEPNTDASDTTPKKNTLEVDTGLSVASGKTLTFQSGIDMEVYPGKVLQVDGTLTADALLNNGTTVVTSGNTLRLRGNLTTSGTLNVTSTGRIVTDGTFTRTGTLTLTAGAAVLARFFAPGAAPSGWEVSATADTNGYYTLVPTDPGPTPPEPGVTYPVNFNANGGLWGVDTEETVVQTNADGTVTWPENPVRTGYTFAGWYDAATGGSAVSRDRVYTSEGVTLYAHWTPEAVVTYTIRFDANGGTLAGASSVTTDKDGFVAAADWPAATRANYSFAGWYTDAAGGTVVSSSDKFGGDMTVYAHWTPVTGTDTYTITFSANGGTLAGSQTTVTATTGADGIVAAADWPGDPTWEDYRFDGWYTANTGGNRVISSSVFTEDTQLYARWTKVNFTITFNVGSGTLTSGQRTVKTDENGYVAAADWPTAAWEDYRLDGWYTANTGGSLVTAGTAGTKFTEDTQVYARWVRQVTVTFDGNGAAWESGAQQTVTVDVDGTVASLPTPPTWVDHRFDGWFTDPSAGTEVTTSTTFSQNTTVYAHWTQVTGTDYHTVSFDPNGGAWGDGSPQNITTNGDGTVNFPPANPTRTGHSFAGWFTEASGGSEITDGHTVSNDETFYAHWTPVTLTITFAQNDGTGATSTASATYGGTVTFPANPTRTGYRFSGWYDAETGGTQVTASTTFNQDTTVYAHWVLQITVTFDANGGAWESGVQQTVTVDASDAGGTITYPADPTRTGFVFAGWWTEVTGGVKVEDTTFMANQKLYAHWTRETYTVTFDANGGTLTGAGTAATDENGKITLPAEPTWTGYSFAGWFTTQADGGTQVTADTEFSENTTVYAHWVQQFTVTFDANGGKWVAANREEWPVTVDAGGTVTVDNPTHDPSPNTSSPYQFAGWFTAADGGTEAVLTNVTADMTVYAHWTLNGVDYEYIESTKTLRIYGNGNMPTASSKPWASYSSQATNLVIDDGVKTISSSAFSLFTLLESASIPESVTEIGASAFQRCEKLQSVNIPQTVTTIGRNAFEWCTSLTAIEIPAGITEVGNYAFSRCTNLASVTLPEGVTRIGAYAFNYCTSLESIELPQALTAIESYAFSNSGLTSADIPDSVESIGSFAFSNCAGLQTAKLSKNISTMQGDVFSTCTALTSVTIPEGVQVLGARTFSGCTGLLKAEIPSTVTSIPERLFSGCNTLNSVTISGPVTQIGDYAFDSCKRLEQINIPSTVKTIGNYAFHSSGLTSVTVPEGVTSIGQYAFNLCTELVSASLPDTVTTMGDGLFYQCDKLTTANIPGNAETVVTNMFARCGLTSITIPETVTTIQNNAFYGNAHLQTVHIPESVTSIGNNAFENCTGLTSVNIPENVKTIEPSVFEGCSSLTQIVIPVGVTNIGNYAFRRAGLTSITIPASVTNIGDSAFASCGSLTKVLVPGNVTTLGESIFYNCTSLGDVELGEGVPQITARMFDSCSSLVRFVIPGSVTTIASNAFASNSVPLYIYYRGTEEEWQAIANRPTPAGSMTYDYTGTLVS